jgi:hypothetical protein
MVGPPAIIAGEQWIYAPAVIKYHRQIQNNAPGVIKYHRRIQNDVPGVLLPPENIFLMCRDSVVAIRKSLLVPARAQARDRARGR